MAAIFAALVATQQITVSPRLSWPSALFLLDTSRRRTRSAWVMMRGSTQPLPHKLGCCYSGRRRPRREAVADERAAIVPRPARRVGALGQRDVVQATPPPI